MASQYPPFVDDASPTIGELPKEPQFVKDCAMKAQPDYPEIAARLTRIREWFSDLSQKDWAAKHGFNYTQVNNWERGVRRIPIEAAEKLCDVYGLTLDAIYRGRLDGLSDSARKVF